MSDLISRETAQAEINRLLDKWGYNKDGGKGYMGYEFAHSMDSIPSADIMECARAIKEYCEQFPECEGCRFYNGLPFRCTFGICPQEWNLPTPWADNNIFEKGGNDDNT